MRRVFLAVIASLLVVCATAALADDLNPPQWRGNPGTTFGEWDFSTNSTTPLPEAGYSYPYGMPTTSVAPGLFQSWLSSHDGHDGVWPLSGQIEVTIPNRPQPLPQKFVWIQLTWEAQAPNEQPAVSEERFSLPSSLLEQDALGGGWYHSTYLISIQPNPDWEKVLITGAVNVDQMVIDTWCIPEPGSIAALGLGLVGLAGYSRRRRR